MSLKLAARFVGVVPQNIGNFQENDTVKHVLDISAYVPEGTVMVLVQGQRVSGTGMLLGYPNSLETEYTYIERGGHQIQSIPIKNREIKWSNSTANDEWNIILFGYFVQKRTR